MTRYVPPIPIPVPVAAPAQPGRRAMEMLPMLLASRLSERDRLILRALWDHHVLTTGQIAQLAYPSDDRARRRMLRLAGLGAVERFRPLLAPGAGTAPMHHILGQAGAHVIAAELDVPFAELGYRRDKILAWSLSPKLPHLIGTNGVFTALAAAARRHSAAELATWWPERKCARTWAPYIRPDGFGRWREGGERGVGVDFFLEYDTGTESLKKVAAKLRGYTALANADGYTTPVLIWTSTPKREANLHAQIGTPPIPVFITNPQAVRDPQMGPAGPVWLPAGHRTSNPRLRLSALSRYTRPHPATGGDDADL